MNGQLNSLKCTCMNIVLGLYPLTSGVCVCVCVRVTCSLIFGSSVCRSLRSSWTKGGMHTQSCTEPSLKHTNTQSYTTLSVYKESVHAVAQLVRCLHQAVRLSLAPSNHLLNVSQVEYVLLWRSVCCALVETRPLNMPWDCSLTNQSDSLILYWLFCSLPMKVRVPGGAAHLWGPWPSPGPPGCGSHLTAAAESRCGRGSSAAGPGEEHTLSLHTVLEHRQTHLTHIWHKDLRVLQDSQGLFRDLQGRV